MTWTGWYRIRPGAQWKRACQGETLGECARRLSAAAALQKIGTTNQIMTGGGYPQIPPTDPKAARGAVLADEK